MLAQSITPTPADAIAFYQFWLIVVSIGTAVGVVVSVIGVLYNIFSNKKQRNSVSFEETPASKDEFDKHTSWDAAEHRAIWDRINNEKKEAAEAVRARHDKLYAHIDEIRLELKVDIAQLRESVDDKIDALPERVIATLKNTGALDRHNR
jgi:hypothetical protein